MYNETSQADAGSQIYAQHPWMHRSGHRQLVAYVVCSLILMYKFFPRLILRDNLDQNLKRVQQTRHSFKVQASFLFQVCCCYVGANLDSSHFYEKHLMSNRYLCKDPKEDSDQLTVQCTPCHYYNCLPWPRLQDHR